MLSNHIFLIGFMGCGKSTNAKELARLTGAECLEMDEEIVKSAGMEITEIFSRFGQEYFRDLETALLEGLRSRVPAVVSCGGGAVLRPKNVALMKEAGTVVLLTASPESVYGRVKDSDDRPNLNGNMNLEYIAALMETRRESYEAAADAVVSTDQKSPSEICGEILEIMGRKAEERAAGETARQ